MILWLFSAGFPKGGHQRGSIKFVFRKYSFLQSVVLIDCPQLCKFVHFYCFFLFFILYFVCFFNFLIIDFYIIVFFFLNFVFF